MAAVGFSKTTSALLVSPSVVTLMSLILPLRRVSGSLVTMQERVNLPEAEEVLDLAVAGRAGDVLDLNSAYLRSGRHSVGCVVVYGA